MSESVSYGDDNNKGGENTDGNLLLKIDALKDRDSVKELLQQLLPQFKNKFTITEDIDQKQKILSEDPELYALYRDLVTTGVVSSDEFWQNYAPATKKLSSMRSGKSQQNVGISPSFLSNITQMDGCNGVKYNLTNDIIESIFKTYPAVERKHLEMVPHEMTDKEFWEKFFQSQYFYRDRTISGTLKDIFLDCVKQDEIDMKAEVEQAMKESNVDLSQITEQLPPAVQDLDEGPKSNSSHAALLRRFNYHSGRVLKACLGEDQPSTSTSTIIGASLPQTSKDTTADTTSGSLATEPPAKKRRRIDSGVADIESGDLAAEEVLMLSEPKLYQEGNRTERNTEDIISDKQAAGGGFSVAEASDFHAQNVEAQYNLCGQVLREICSQMDNEDSEGTCGNQDDKTYDVEYVCWLYSKELIEEIRNVYVAIAELLRHFWCCFPAPTRTPDLEKKTERMFETLHKFETNKLNPLEEKMKQKFGADNTVALHMRAMLEEAYDKYQSWVRRRAPKKSDQNSNNNKK